MTRVRVKICGITSLEDLQMVVSAGADAVGFIVNVPSSPRSISITEAKSLILATPPFVTTVIVTVADLPSQVVEIYQQTYPQVLQVHGLNAHAHVLRTRLPHASIIGALPAQETSLKTAKLLSADFNALLVDSYSSKKHGGTGRTHDWTLSKKIKTTIAPVPVILAGGLNPSNVLHAIQIVRPYAVDVASGVESQPGKKDNHKVIDFIQNVKKLN
jgi:phosphoribosylanthranilate isomerase